MLHTNSDMHLFVAAVEEQGFAAAARRLAVSPSTVSKAINRLEAALSVRLVDRDTRHFVATSEGLTFYHGCCRAIEAMQDAEASVSGSKLQAKGKLRVSVSASTAEARIGPMMHEFHAAYPEIDIAFHLRNGYVDPIEAGVDITISHEPPVRDTFVARRLCYTPLLVCAAPSYLERRGWPQRPTDLRDHNCILSTREVFNTWQFEEAGELRPQPVHGAFRASQGSMLRQLALSGVGIANLMTYQVRDDLRAGRLVELLPRFRPTQGIPLYAVYHDRRNLNARIRCFVDFLADILTRDDDTPRPYPREVGT